MKQLPLFSAFVFLFSVANPQAIFSQSWAPFNADKQIIYSATDTIVSMNYQQPQKWGGSNLYLLRMDTTIDYQTYKEFKCEKCMRPVAFYQLTQIESGIQGSTIFGSIVRQYGDTFRFINYSNPGILFLSKSEPGDTIFQYQDQIGVVTGKVLEGTDSIKIIAYKRSGLNHGQPVQLRFSKEKGLLDIPDFFGNYKLIFRWFADYNSDFHGIKSFHPENCKFRPGDKFGYSSWEKIENSWPYYPIEDQKTWTSSTVLSLIGDSCLIVDTIRKINQLSWTDSLVVRPRKILNSWANGTISYLSQYNFNLSNYLSSKIPVDSWFNKICFMTSDSVLFIGGTSGYFEGGASFLLNSKFPVHYHHSSSGGAVGSSVWSRFEEFPEFFSRGDTILGTPLDIHFVSKKSQIIPQMDVWPNPSTGTFYLYTNSTMQIDFCLTDTWGRTIKSGLINSVFSEISIDNVQKGIYFLQLVSPLGKSVKKLVINK